MNETVRSLIQSNGHHREAALMESLAAVMI